MLNLSKSELTDSQKTLARRNLQIKNNIQRYVLQFRSKEPNHPLVFGVKSYIGICRNKNPHESISALMLKSQKKDSNLISESLPNLGSSKRKLAPIVIVQIFEIYKYALCSFRTHVPATHEVEDQLQYQEKATDI